MFFQDLSRNKRKESSCEFIYSPDKKMCVLTTLEGKIANIEWKINNFSRISSGEEIESPEFSSDNKEYSWSLLLSRRSSNYNDSLVIKLNGHKMPANYKVKFSLLNVKDKKKMFEHETSYSDGIWTELSDGIWNELSDGIWTELMEMIDFKNAYFINKDCLTIFCEIYRPNDPIHVVRELREDKDNKTKDTLVGDLNTLLSDSKFSDISLFVGGDPGKEFRLHKAILAARSAYFAAMFNTKMEEASTNLIKIPDQSPALMEEIIRYIYTGKVTNLKEKAEDLYKSADYFNLENLKEMCAKQMCSNLTSNNAIDILKLAYSYNDSGRLLKDEVLNYITRYPHEVFKSESWKNLEYSNLELEKDVYKAIVQKDCV